MGRNLIKQQKSQPTSGPSIPSQPANIATLSHAAATFQSVNYSMDQWMHGPMGAQGTRMTRTSYFFVFCGQLSWTWHVFSKCQAGSDQCCSGEGLSALSSTFIAIKQSISHTSFPTSLFRDSASYFNYSLSLIF